MRTYSIAENPAFPERINRVPLYVDKIHVGYMHYIPLSAESTYELRKKRGQYIFKLFHLRENNKEVFVEQGKRIFDEAHAKRVFVEGYESWEKKYNLRTTR